MRVDLEPLDPFLALMRESRPCPACGSLRVTVQRAGVGASGILRAVCADCQRESQRAAPEPAAIK